MSSVLIGTLGAVMDVAITISSGMYEILQRTPHISMARWVLAGRHIGQRYYGYHDQYLIIFIFIR